MKGKQLTATTLRAILATGIVLIVSICVAVFVVANNQLKAVATEVNRATVDADASRNNLQTLQAIQAELKKQKDTVERAQSIVADSQSYQYQNQIIADLNDYARQAGISITNLDFGATTNATSTPAPAATPSASGDTPSTPTGPVGVKSTSVSVTLANPIDYKTLLNFIRLIEQNLTKMQVSKVGLSADATSGKVTSDSLTIEVYIKS